MRTSGKAGYRVWKLAGGHGDHDISLPFNSFEELILFVFKVSEVFVSNPLYIVLTKGLIITITKIKSVFKYIKPFWFIVLIKVIFF